jgi:hypothetical protein
MIINLPADGSVAGTLPSSGKEVQCDLSTLMEKVLVAPVGPPFMSELVRDICNRFGLSAAVAPSELADVPPNRRA